MKESKTMNAYMNLITHTVILASLVTTTFVVTSVTAQSPAGAPNANPTQGQPIASSIQDQIQRAVGQGGGIDASARMAWAEVLEAAPNPKVVTDAGMRASIQATGLPWKVRDRVTGIEMLLVPSGKFVMGMSVGDEDANSDEKPSHEVILTKPFYLGQTEVTQEQWTRLMGTNQSYFQDINFEVIPAADRDEKIAELLEAGYTRQQAEQKLGAVIMENVVTATWPAETLTWEDVRSFMQKSGLRLPTEAEWEYACRAGSTGPLYGELNRISWNTSNSENRTHPVGSKLPNALGFYDMIGNVWEWTNDWYAADYYRACENGATDPTGAAQNPFRTLRGGSWDFDGKNCRASFRLNYFQGDPRITDYGFRVARTP